MNYFRHASEICSNAHLHEHVDKDAQAHVDVHTCGLHVCLFRTDLSFLISLFY